MTIIEALTDRRLFGALPAFRDLSSWTRWLVFLKAVYGLALDDDETAIFTEHTDRAHYAPPAGGWPEAVAVVGRQSGKTFIAATTASYEALRADGNGDGTETWALLVAQDQRAALRTLLAYARAPFLQVPALQRCVVASRADSLTLANGVVLAAYPSRPHAVRGARARVAILDELGEGLRHEDLAIQANGLTDDR